MATMTIWMIWARDSSDAMWMTDAWDDDSVSENDSGWAEAVAKAYKDHGAENVRIVKGDVDFNAIEKAFQIPAVGPLGSYRVVGEKS